eukprot:767484-Hanusia_phi.AAC.4
MCVCGTAEQGSGDGARDDYSQYGGDKHCGESGMPAQEGREADCCCWSGEERRRGAEGWKEKAGRVAEDDKDSGKERRWTVTCWQGAMKRRGRPPSNKPKKQYVPTGRPRGRPKKSAPPA